MSTDPPLQTLYDLLGGDAGVAALVERFYHQMDTLPEVAEIRALHPPDLQTSREKLTLFLCGWTGGPPRYIERYGHPRLRARHLPFPIDTHARDQWMRCMDRALAEHTPPLPPPVAAQFRAVLAQMADHMRNR